MFLQSGNILKTFLLKPFSCDRAGHDLLVLGGRVTERAKWQANVVMLVAWGVAYSQHFLGLKLAVLLKHENETAF